MWKEAECILRVVLGKKLDATFALYTYFSKKKRICIENVIVQQIILLAVSFHDFSTEILSLIG